MYAWKRDRLLTLSSLLNIPFPGLGLNACPWPLSQVPDRHHACTMSLGGVEIMIRGDYVLKTIFLFFFTLRGYWLGGFWFLPGPGSPGTSRVFNVTFLVCFFSNLSMMCFVVCKSRYGIRIG